MRLRDSAILLVVLLILVGVWWVVNNPPGRTSEPKRKDIELYRVPNDQLTEIKMTFRGRTMVLEKKDDVWSMTLDGTTLPGDGARISSSSLALGAVVAENEVASQASDYAQFGLEPPRITIEVQGGGRRGALAIGATNPVTRQDYARKPDQPTVYVISPSWGQVVEGLFNDPPFPKPTPTPSPSPTATAMPVR